MSDTQTPAWIADLPEDLRANPTLTSFKGSDWKEVGPVLAKSYVESRSLIGKKAYDLPQDDWKPEQYAAWNKAIGVPESGDGYWKPDDATLEKAGLTKEHLIAYEARALKLGATPRQYKEHLSEDIEMLATQRAEAEKAKAENKAKTEAALSAEFGDKFEARKGLVKSILALGGGDLAERIEAAGYGNDPELFKSLAALGQKILEDKSLKGGTAALGPEASMAAAQQRIAEIKAARVADPKLEAKYDDPRSAERQEWNELQKAAAPKGVL